MHPRELLQLAVSLHVLISKLMQLMLGKAMPAQLRKLMLQQA